ncbi:helix-turn-helix domain-containing protein [Brucella pseudogrignonensis]|uniref:helix-turn-helix domain-containing protein n=1 Tax=Brucella pseudogrignonensis TaxID=419475 RepID=UPI0038CFEF90
MYDILSPPQCRAARALLGWPQDKLAEASAISKPTVAAFEGGKRQVSDKSLFAIRKAFEEAGIAFIAENGLSIAGGGGVRFADPN